MTDQVILQRLRRFLLAVVAFICVGTLFELLLLDHTEETLQWIPFIFSAIGIVSVSAVWVAPKTGSVKILRWVMVGMAAASLLGMYLHFSGNLAFTREINPSFSLMESILPAMKGSYPLLAPGILLLAGVLGVAATYRHPALEE